MRRSSFVGSMALSRTWWACVVALLALSACGDAVDTTSVESSSTTAQSSGVTTTTTTATTTTFDVESLAEDARAVCDGSLPGLSGASYNGDAFDTLHWIGMDDDASARVRSSDISGVPDILGCVSSTRLEEVVRECPYEGGYTVLHYATDWSVKLVRADTGTEVHDAAFSETTAECSQFLNTPDDSPKTIERASLDNLQLRRVAEAVPHALDVEFYCRRVSKRDATDLAPYATMPRVSIYFSGDGGLDPDFALPPEMMVEADEPAKVALCLNRTRLGRDDEIREYMTVSAYHVDGMRLGRWEYEEEAHDPDGSGPVPAPGPDWIRDNLGALLGYPTG